MNFLEWITKLFFGGGRTVYYIGGCYVLPPPLKGEE